MTISVIPNNFSQQDFEKILNSFNEHASFTAKLIKENQKGYVSFEVKENVCRTERLKFIGRAIMNFFQWNWEQIEENWKVGINGLRCKIVKIESTLKIGKLEEFNFSEIKALRSIIQKTNKNEEKIEIDLDSYKILLATEVINGYQFQTEEEITGNYLIREYDRLSSSPKFLTGSLKKLHYYLIKLDSFDSNITTNDFQPQKDFVKNPQQKQRGLVEALNIDLKNISTEKVEIENLNKVTDCNKIKLAAGKIDFTQNGFDFELDVAVAMRKGSGAVPSPKAMGEDFFVMDVVNVQFKDKNYDIPLLAVMDGGGGHILAQTGREKMVSIFKAQLQRLMNNYGKLDASVVVTALSLTHQELFAKSDNEGHFTFPGLGYRQLRENHQKLENETGLRPQDFKAIFQRLKLQMNPLEIHETAKTNPDLEAIISIKGQKYDLRIEEEANKLQFWYEMATGTQDRITVSTTMNAFLVNTEGKTECVTYNAGDTMAYLNNSTTTLALSRSEKESRTTVALEENARVILACDGITDVVSLSELEEVNAFLKETNSEEYVERLMRASIMTGSGDDKTIISARLNKRI